MHYAITTTTATNDIQPPPRQDLTESKTAADLGAISLSVHPQERKAETRRTRELLDIFLHDKIVAMEISRMPERDWVAIGDRFARPYSTDIAYDMVSKECFSLYSKGLLLVEDVEGDTLAEVGIVIRDSDDYVLVKASKRIVVADCCGRGEVAAMEGLVLGLEVALELGLKRFHFYCDDLEIFLYFSGKKKAMEGKLAELVNYADHLRKRISDDQSQLVFELVRSSIGEQSGMSLKTEAFGNKECIELSSSGVSSSCSKKRKPNPKSGYVSLGFKWVAKHKKAKRLTEKRKARLKRVSEKKWWREIVRYYDMLKFAEGCDDRVRGYPLNQVIAKLTEERAEYISCNPLPDTSMIIPDQVPSNIDRYRSVLDEYLRDGNQWQITIPRQLFHYDHFDIHIGKDEIERWLKQDEIEACHLSVYIRYLVENRCADASDMFGFLCPDRISPGYVGGPVEDRAEYVASAMEGNIHNKIFFGPYNLGGHWVLIVFSPQFNHAYWIDSLHGRIREDARILVEMSHAIKYAELGDRKPRPNTLWHRIACPLQDMMDCGFYVLRSMREIIDRRCLQIPLCWYDEKTSYTRQEIGEIQTEWMDFVLGLNS